MLDPPDADRGHSALAADGTCWKGDRSALVAMAERDYRSVFEIAALPGMEPMVAGLIEKATGHAVPGPGRWRATACGAVFWIGPHRWRWVSAGADGVLAEMHGALPSSAAAIVDMSGGLTALRITGENAAALLRKGVALDLDRTTFPSGACAVTPVHRIRALLARMEEDAGYELHVSRSYAVSLWQLLKKSAAQHGSGAAD